MNMPVSGVHPRVDAQPSSSSISYINGEEEGLYNEQDETHFVQNFVGSPQFLPYQLPGYFQHPGFTSQLYSDGRGVFTSNQLYPFGAQQYMVAPENFTDQLQNNYPYSSKVVQSNGHQDSNEEKVYNIHPPHEQNQERKPKKKPVPKSWADVANTPASKQQPNQILTKQTSKPEEKPKSNKKSESRTESQPSVTKFTLPSLDHINTTYVDTNPTYARFFVIKSYSEDDVHKAIKYNIWASTDSGNRRLDAAFKESGTKGPIYLFFSVNASGQFCGMAQMLTAIDYEKKSDLWAQDKWNGQFNLKWIFIKDIPNSQLRHMRLENNDNKPVTNSRDTQEVLLEPGKELLRIFSSFKAKSSILDDFVFYDKRQELMKEKKLQTTATSSPQQPENEPDLPTGSNRTRSQHPKQRNDE